ncbi:hypothetical protein VP01_731g5 [Puccinia sorghi]|uniref:Prolyl 4-hydroxylase alpha subunit domain-containing protein n=1 Tax=Puccinia sorghi TaxID=27349 RepID=A0A0L6UF35_9BASI|nr:hypothetical protein VP01_731g5 [Puccinia sorghi]
MTSPQKSNPKVKKAGRLPQASASLSAGSHAGESTGWPSLKPKWKLQVNTIIRSQIMTVNELFTEEECRRVIEALEHVKTADGHALRFETTSQVPKRGEAFRYNDRISVCDPVFAQTLWANTGLKTACEAWLREQGAHPQHTRCWGLNPNLRFYRYRVGHKFEKHFDQSVQISKFDLLPSRTESEMPPENLWTEYTLLIYLTGSKDGPQKSSKQKVDRADCRGISGSLITAEADQEEPLQGGETVFYDTPIRSQKRLTREHSIAASVRPVAGLALIHRHGSQCLLHEARQVVSGAKYVLRSDLIFG